MNARHGFGVAEVLAAKAVETSMVIRPQRFNPCVAEVLAAKAVETCKYNASPLMYKVSQRY